MLYKKGSAFIFDTKNRDMCYKISNTSCLLSTVNFSYFMLVIISYTSVGDIKGKVISYQVYSLIVQIKMKSIKRI